MSTENETKSISIEHPLLFGLILTIIYGFVAYLSDFFDLETMLFTSTLSPFESILLTFIFRFTLSGILLLLLTPIVLYAMKGITFQDFVFQIRLRPNQMLKRNILMGIIVSLSFASCVVLTAIFLGVYTSDFHLLITPDYQNGLGWFIFIFALIPGIWEEIAFRGVILSFLLSKFSVRNAMIFSGLLFSLFHIFNFLILGQDLLSVLLQSIAAIPVGISLAYLVFKTDSILPAILIHYSIDVTLFISGFIFDLSNENSASLFAILSLIVLPPLLISLFTLIFDKNSTGGTAKVVDHS